MDADIPPPPYSQTDLNPRKSPCSKSSEIVAPRGYFNTPYLLQTPVVSTIDLIDHQPCFEGSFLILEPTHLCFSLQEPLYPGAAPCQIYQLQRSPLSRPQDFPHFPQFSLRDITEQDWTAFLNELRPANTTNPSSNLNSGQCLKAERVVKEMYGLSLSDSGLSGIWIGSDSALIAALNQASHHSEITSSLSYFATEWNKKFFAPRGMKIIFNKRNDIPLHLEKKNIAQRPLVTKKSFFQDGYGFKIGPILVNRQGFRIGQVLVVDQNGFRLGRKRGIHAGINQLTLGGRAVG
ncbi:BgTH12-07848 [Blumeria graminis f. sp. triticale]|uniref:BgTH12-06389 n=1 Tax=Blumeria graminis f. sp. triticale TaxID=1689686 RepID=A0A9W4DJ78_BLUGR|nr:BgTH12-06389 [Blumeria graminis f. sp. triticale]CAD6506622.1 BgTH12-07848 [Blumeria graminis f. sp. triticale]